jgi:hypothetical protein
MRFHGQKETAGLWMRRGCRRSDAVAKISVLTENHIVLTIVELIDLGPVVVRPN